MERTKEGRKRTKKFIAFRLRNKTKPAEIKSIHNDKEEEGGGKNEKAQRIKQKNKQSKIAEEKKKRSIESNQTKWAKTNQTRKK
jgi:hypothetical protein